MLFIEATFCVIARTLLEAPFIRLFFVFCLIGMDANKKQQLNHQQEEYKK